MLIHAHAGRRGRAPVRAVRDTVSVGIRRAALSIHNRSLRRVRTAIGLIGDSIPIRITVQGTTVRTDECGQLGIRAVIEIIADTVNIAVHADFGVNRAVEQQAEPQQQHRAAKSHQLCSPQFAKPEP